ncbi:GvpL/GvpF family gas vesicle protein [Streptomyces sp. NPDC059378]|uniref:GvpL/GvpF family gas vesicle protein n=1 Tax=Streptomyces sp. NPDC059378 TaxID=3346815 RepID=UPI0036C4089A
MAGPRYVYAVCRPFRAALQAQLTGVAGAPVGLLGHHGLVAVVSTVPERDFAEEPLHAHWADPQWRAAAARAHRGVVDALTAVTTPLPLRTATVCPDDSALRLMLETHGAEFTRALDRLEGRVEWSVNVYSEKQPTALSEEAETFVTRLHGLLSRYADESCFRDPEDSMSFGAAGHAGHTVLNASYLVARTDSEQFVELVDRLKAEAPGLQVELTGPWAAYSFTGENEEKTENPDSAGTAEFAGAHRAKRTWAS